MKLCGKLATDAAASFIQTTCKSHRSFPRAAYLLQIQDGNILNHPPLSSGILDKGQV